MGVSAQKPLTLVTQSVTTLLTMTAGPRLQRLPQKDILTVLLMKAGEVASRQDRGRPAVLDFGPVRSIFLSW